MNGVRIGEPSAAIDELTRAADVTVEGLMPATPKWVLDLHGRLGAEIEQPTGYEGVRW